MDRLISLYKCIIVGTIFRMLRIILILCISWLTFLYFQLPNLIWHSGILLSYFLSRDLIFYKDFINFYFPFSTFFVLPLYLLTNWNMKVEPVTSLIIAAITLLILYKISRKILSQIGVSIVLVFFALLFYYFTTGVQYCLEALAGLFLTVIICYLFSSRVKSLNSVHIFSLGLLIGIMELTGQIITMTVGVIIGFTIFLFFQNTKINSVRFKNIIVLGLGIVFPFFIISSYFLYKGAFSDFFNYNVTYYFTYLRLANEKGSLLQLPWGDIFLFYNPFLLSLLLIVSRTSISGNLKVKFYFLVLANLVTIPSIVFSVFHPHHFLYALPVISLLAGLSFDLAKQAKNKILHILIFLLGAIVIYFLITNVLPWYFKKIKSGHALKNRIINDSVPGDSMYEAAMWVKNNTPENATLTVAGDGLFYFKSNRVPANKFHVILPWHLLPLNESIPVMQVNRPDYWIIGQGYLERISSPDGWDSPEITNFINTELQTYYLKAASLPDWEIWKKSCPALKINLMDPLVPK